MTIAQTEPAARPSSRIGDFTVTFTGRRFWPLDPRPEEVDGLDLAHALSNLCRFGGHTRFHYSVAQHSLLMADQAPPELKLAVLLHDAAEAYFGDIQSPVKRYVEVRYLKPGSRTSHPRGYQVSIAHVENAIRQSIHRRFGLVVTKDQAAEIRNLDLRMLATEKRDLMHDRGEWSNLVGVEPFPFTVTQWPADYTKTQFLNALVGMKEAA